MNFSNSLTSVFAFNVFPHPKLVPSTEFLGLFPLVLQQPRQRLELTNLSNVIRLEFCSISERHGCQVVCLKIGGHEIYGELPQKVRIIPQVFSSSCEWPNSENDKPDLLEKNLVNCNLAQELKVYDTVHLYWIIWTRNGPILFRDGKTRVLWPHDIHSRGGSFALTITWL